MTFYLVEGNDIVFKQIYYSPTLWAGDPAKEKKFQDTAAKLLALHADALVEGDGRLGVGAGQDDVVERADLHTQIMSCLRYGQRPVAGGTRRPYLAPSRLSSSISSFFVAVALSE